MYRIALIILTLCGLLFTASAHAVTRNLVVKAADAQQQKRVALVIGNSTYQGIPALRNPVNDATAMAETLNKLGFEVIEVTDATQKEMNRAIASFGGKLTSDSAALFFYAGHGLQVKGKNYLVPVDAQIDTEASVSAETVNVDTVLDQLAASTVSIVILDACRNNPFEHAFRKMGGGLAQMDAPKGSFIAYATAPGKTAVDGTGNHGLFTQELLKQIDTPGLTINDVFMRVRANVAHATADQQIPWDASSMTGNFYFKPGKEAQVTSLEPAAPVHIKTREEIEQETWESAKDSNDAATIREYMKQYPKGRYIAQAKVLLTKLKAGIIRPGEAGVSPVPVASAGGREDEQTALWNEAQKGNSKEDYQAYLEQYPKGKYATLAKSRIKKLQDEAQAAAEQQEQEAWEAAGQENSEASYGRYLKGYPNGRYARLAKARQEKLRIDLAAKEEAELWKKAESGSSHQAVEAYLNKYPSGRYIAAANAKLQAIKEEESKFHGPEMVSIPGRNYEIGKFDVTRGQFAEFVNETGYDAGNSCVVWNGSKLVFRVGNNWRNPSFTQDDSHPVTCVNWNDAQAYISWLNNKTGRQYRLPTESEWEYACYGGSQTEYCGGNDINSVAWYFNNSSRQTHPVGQKQANGYGLYDMSGNVFEWMSDCWKDVCARRVMRSGSWVSNAKDMLSSQRYGIYVTARNYGFGFRLARTLP